MLSLSLRLLLLLLPAVFFWIPLLCFEVTHILLYGIKLVALGQHLDLPEYGIALIYIVISFLCLISTLYLQPQRYV